MVSINTFNLDFSDCSNVWSIISSSSSEDATGIPKINLRVSEENFFAWALLVIEKDQH